MATRIVRSDAPLSPPTTVAEGEIEPTQVDPRIIRSYRDELGRARVASLLPRQEKLADAAIDFCLHVLHSWKDTCRCEPKFLSESMKEKYFSRPGNSKTCAACKRVQWVLQIWTETERLALRRQEIDAGIMKMLMNPNRKSENELPENLSVAVFQSYHAQAQQKAKEEAKQAQLID